jgi:leucyl-tRNA synthetase
VNGKVRATIDVAKAAGAAEVAALARAHERVEPFLAGKEVVKEVYVPQKVLNFIVR